MNTELLKAIDRESEICPEAFGGPVTVEAVILGLKKADFL